MNQRSEDRSRMSDIRKEITIRRGGPCDRRESRVSPRGGRPYKKAKRISRRRFLFIGVKAFLVAAAAFIVPINISFSKDDNSQRRRFKIKIKPFKRSDLYKKHNLAG
ncbi:MAG: hypothetical protein ABH872_03010 [Candidatus Omnitrophota bacterium]